MIDRDHETKQGNLYWGIYVLLTIIVAIGIIIFLKFFISTFPEEANQDWATLIATDDTLVELGDAAHAFEINPDTSLHVGDTYSVFELNVTLTNAGFLHKAENVSGEFEYWFVEFYVENIGDEIQYGIHPVVNTQLQFLVNDSYGWKLPEEKQCTPKIEIIADGLEPKNSFQCRFIYLVPSNETNLFWVYYKTDYGIDGEFETRYIVFQIR